ncbi:helix-turn-helix domain-containing protein [Microbacterium sp.]|uniref:helix-turn-helix transcriptional regulator n=1 Tax=Microbacterium sp. TaxID=51671 RepID=UPI0032420929
MTSGEQLRALPESDDVYLTPQWVALYLSRSVAALAGMRHRGTGPKFTKAGGRIRYRSGDVRAWLEAGSRDAT